MAHHATQVATGKLTGPGATQVNIGNKPMGRCLDRMRCSFNPPEPELVITGASDVLINGLPAARVNDQGECSELLELGSPSVRVGGATATIPISIRGGSPAFEESVRQAMAKLYGTRTGKVLLAGIAARNCHVVLVETSAQNGFTTPDSASAAMDPSRGCSSTIQWNPDHTMMPHPDGPTVLLGHEMVHAYHNARGTRERGPLDQYPGQTGSSNRGEERKTVGLPGGTIVQPDGTTAPVPDHSSDVPTENSLRDDLGLPRRPSYYPSPWGGGPAPW